ncbi:MAG: ribonuclease E inhibitor RraB [Paracoccaceae bacterium]
MDHDFEDQKAETYQIFGQIKGKHSLPAEAVIEYQFIPMEGEADWAAFAAAAKAAGYTTAQFPDEDYIEISTAPVTLDAATIWLHEHALTEIALKTGFAPDGWGFVAG